MKKTERNNLVTMNEVMVSQLVLCACCCCCAEEKNESHGMPMSEGRVKNR